MKKFYLSVPQEIESRILIRYIEEYLKMEINSAGAGTTDFISDEIPENFRNKIIKNFGIVTYDSLQFKLLDEPDEG